MKKLLPLFLLIVLASCADKTRFELLESDQTGITFINTVNETDSLNVISFEYIYNGAGVGIVDLNNDGRQDIIFTGNMVASKVYLNKGDFKFTDISTSFEGLDNGNWYSGVSVVDINNDGWKDIYFTCTAYNDSLQRRNKLYINQGFQENGELLFEEKAKFYGIDDDSYSVHASFFDYDRDGDLDLYLLNNFINERLSASYRAKIIDGSAASNDDLYRNNGDGTFSNVTIEAGIIYEGFGLGLALGDVNKDGYPDIYVSNDYVSNDLLYINQGDGTFKNEIATYLSYQTKSSMGNDMADINNDGNPDMFTLDMLPEYYYKKKQTINGFGYIYYASDEKYGYEHQYLRNMMHMHNGFVNGEMVPYSEMGQMMGIYQSEWSWSPLFADYDNDGDKDLLIANGYPRDMTDKDWTKYKAKVYGSIASERHVIEKTPTVKAYNFAFENNGPYSFKDVSRKWFKRIKSYSYGAAFVDLDNDGDLDYVTNNLNDIAFVYRNNTMERGGEEKNYLRIKLLGTGNNTDAYGAKVEVWYGEQYQFHEHFLSRGYISSMDPVSHFGVSSNRIIDSVKVTWPASSYVSVLQNVSVNQTVEIDEKGAVAPLRQANFQDEPDYLFSRINGVMNYKHQQNDFVDFSYYQAILPHKFSQIGPCMQQGDLDGDGQADIIIGATNKVPTRIYLHKADQYIQTEVEGLTSMKNFSESDFAIFDADNDGDNDIVALAGGYEKFGEEYLHYLYENEGGHFIRKELPLPSFPASVVRPFDFDHDGDMDLFIGSRTKVGMFPLASDSWLLINEQGNYLPEDLVKYNLGMVTDATWSDYDGDGWEDLIIAREWNSVMIMKNIEGEKLISQDIPEFESRHGMWFSINSGDFDADGDPDYILGNLGENHRFTISDQYPLRIYALDLDLNGSLDPISTGYWKNQYDVMTEYPINYLDELTGQSNFFIKRFDGYTSFSYASIDQMLDSATMNRVDHTFYVNTASSFILWNEEGAFRWEELPAEAQVSPIKKSIIEDFNDDGYPDVLLAGNDYTYDIGTGYYDANKGLLLMSSDGVPLNKLLAPSESGIVLNGMVESLLYLEGETPLIIAGMNRDSVVTYSLNR
jgi:hypothetical protein